MGSNSTELTPQGQGLHQLPPSGDGSSVLSHAQALRGAGLHGQAIDWLEGAMRADHLRRDQTFTGMAMALKARSQVHLLDDAGAILTAGLVPAVVRQFNPKVDAYCLLVTGLVHRRRAYRGWKDGTLEPHILHASIDCFRKARHAAESAIEERLACIAVLNGLYVQGLQAAIAGRSREENPRLLVAAIQAEATALAKTPMDESANIAGSIIIADLAIGAGLQPRQLHGLSDAPAFRAASLTLLGADPGTWPRELLRIATGGRVGTDQKARALVLGSRVLTQSGIPAEDGLARAYLVHLADCDFRLRKAAADAGNGKAASPCRVPGVGEQLALLARQSKRPVPLRSTFR